MSLCSQGESAAAATAPEEEAAAEEVSEKEYPVWTVKV